MLSLRNVQTYYGNIQALHDVSIDIAEGEIVALIGANGAGKTTTLMSICGIVPPRRGEIYFKGTPINGLSPEKIVQLGICQVPEGRRIFPNMTVMENLEMGAFLRKDKEKAQQDLQIILELFPSEGSSRSSRLRRAMRAREMASICCSPPERVPPS